MSNVRFDYWGERVLVTGAAGLIGRALVCRFAGAGADVLAVDRDPCVAPASVVGDVRPTPDLPSGRTTAPEEVADAALFLASPAAGQFNGSTLFIDGGLLARLRTGSDGAEVTHQVKAG